MTRGRRSATPTSCARASARSTTPSPTRSSAACAAAPPERLSAIVAEQGGDTVFAIDRVSEAVLVERFAEIAREWPCLLIAEGLGADGRLILPRGTSLSAVEIAVIVDPIDGTRGLMYQKRPAWILTGVAAIDSIRTRAMPDARRACPTSRSRCRPRSRWSNSTCADQLWAIAGSGAHAERRDRVTGARAPLALRPSTATDDAARLRRRRALLSGRARGAGGDRRRRRGRAARPAARGRRAVVRGSVHLDRRPALRADASGTIAGSPICARSSMRRCAGAASRPACAATPTICAPSSSRARPASSSPMSAAAPVDAPLDVFTDVAWIGYRERDAARPDRAGFDRNSRETRPDRAPIVAVRHEIDLISRLS